MKQAETRTKAWAKGAPIVFPDCEEWKKIKNMSKQIGKL